MTDGNLINTASKRIVQREYHPQNQQLEGNSVEGFALEDEEADLFSWPLKWYHWLWASLPMLLIFSSAFLGFLFGLFATHWNVKILQSRRGTAVKFLMMLGVMGTTVVFHFLLVGSR